MSASFYIFDGIAVLAWDERRDGGVGGRKSGPSSKGGRRADFLFLKDLSYSVVT